MNTNWFDLTARTVTALAAVYAFYAAAGTKWPSSYYLLDDVIGSRVARTARSFLIFRFVPLFVATICALGYLDNVVDRLLVAAAIAIGHLAISVLRINPYLNPGPRRTKSWWVLQVVILIVSIGVIGLASWIAPKLGQSLPQWRDIVVAAVTALLVVSGSVLIQGITSRDAALAPSAIERSRARYEELVSTTALRCSVDRRFALALVVVEDLQRPNWFRTIERRLARARLASTVGLGQNASDWFVTDEQGVQMLLSSIGDICVNGKLSRARMAAAAERLNEGDGYVEFVLDVYDRLCGSSYTTSRIDSDGNPLIVAVRPVLMRGRWLVEGDVGPSIGTLYAVNEYDGQQVQVTLPPMASNGARRAWRVSLPIDWDQYSILESPAASADCHSKLDMYSSI